MGSTTARVPFISNYAAIGIVIVAVFIPVFRSARIFALIGAVSLTIGLVIKKSPSCRMGIGSHLCITCIFILLLYALLKNFLDKRARHIRKMMEEKVVEDNVLARRPVKSPREQEIEDGDVLSPEVLKKMKKDDGGGLQNLLSILSMV